jgi:hypothetical protein
VKENQGMEVEKERPSKSSQAVEYQKNGHKRARISSLIFFSASSPISD